VFGDCVGCSLPFLFFRCQILFRRSLKLSMLRTIYRFPEVVILSFAYFASHYRYSIAVFSNIRLSLYYNIRLSIMLIHYEINTAYEVYVACSLFFILSPDLCFGVRHFVKYLLLFRVVINQFLLFMPLASFFSFFVIFANTLCVYIVIRSISDNCYFNIRLSLYYNIRLSIMLI